MRLIHKNNVIRFFVAGTVIASLILFTNLSSNLAIIDGGAMKCAKFLFTFI